MGYRIRLNERARQQLAKLLKHGLDINNMSRSDESVEVQKLGEQVIKALEDTGEYVIILDE